MCTVSSGRAYLAWSARARFSELAEPAVGRGGAPRLTRDQLTAQLVPLLAAALPLICYPHLPPPHSDTREGRLLWQRRMPFDLIFTFCAFVVLLDSFLPPDTTNRDDLYFNTIVALVLWPVCY